MRATISILASMLVLSTGLAACKASSTGSTASRYGSGSPSQTTVAPPAPATVSAVIPTAEGATISLAVADSALGKILADGSGMTLYVLTNDGPNQSTCNNACASNWPPLSLAVEGIAGPGVDSALLGSMTRTDGSLQVTYAGRPLYHFAADSRAGDLNGQGISGVWFVISPAGEPIEG